MRRLIILFLFLFINSLSSIAQMDQDTVWVDDSYIKVEQKDSASYFFFISEKYAEKDLSGYIYYYPSGEKRADKFKSDNGRWRGWFAEFYKNGQKKSDGEYHKDGSYKGKWNTWSPQGELTQTFEYKNDFSPSILFFRDSTGTITVRDGNGHCYLPDKVNDLLARGKVRKGEKTGTWEGVSETGDVIYREEYRKGELKEGIRYHEGREIMYEQISISAYPIAGYEVFYKYISQNLVYPQEAITSGFEGKVFVQFSIDENGNMIEPKVVKGIHSSMDNEALRIVSNFNGWVPGYHRGVKVKQRMIVPIVFSLN